MNVPENWMFDNGKNFKTLKAHQLCPLGGDIGS